jgi:hypothetical protein
MVNEPAKPNPAQDLLRIHKVITRGLNVNIDEGRQFMEKGFPNPDLKQGYSNYAFSLASVLDGHHLTEDNVIFPVLKIKLPQGPYEHLSKEHLQIEALLVPVRQAVEGLSTTEWKTCLMQLLDGLEIIRTVWTPHIRMEESIFSQEALSSVMNSSEQMDLSAQAGKYSSEHSNPPFLAVPFVLFNLSPEDREIMLSHMPPMMMQEIVMKAWKEQWAAMKPFLLSD